MENYSVEQICCKYHVPPGWTFIQYLPFENNRIIKKYIPLPANSPKKYYTFIKQPIEDENEDEKKNE